jgi:hypothetical protein
MSVFWGGGRKRWLATDGVASVERRIVRHELGDREWDARVDDQRIPKWHLFGVEPLFQQNQAMSARRDRYGKLAADYLAFIKLASIRICSRTNGSTPCERDVTSRHIYPRRVQNDPVGRSPTCDSGTPQRLN